VVSLFTLGGRAAGIHWTGGNGAPEQAQNGVVEKSDPHWEMSSKSLGVQCSHHTNRATRLKKGNRSSKLKHTFIESLFKTVFKIMRSSNAKNYTLHGMYVFHEEDNCSKYWVK